jgi:hypothetical protein
MKPNKMRSFLIGENAQAKARQIMVFSSAILKPQGD